MTISMPAPKATRYSIHDAIVTYKGDEYLFWAELDLLDDSFVAEFDDDEPQGDFDWKQWQQETEARLRAAVAGLSL